MKRRLFIKLALFLLLGAIVNVAVAWGLALRYHSISSNRHAIVDSFDNPSWDLIYGKNIGELYISSMPLSEEARLEYKNYKQTYGETLAEYYKRVWPGIPQPNLPAWSRTSKTSKVAEIDSTPAQVERAQGWPLRSLRMKSIRRYPNGKRLNDRWWIGIDLSDYNRSNPLWSYDRALALYPIVPGFVINTVLYSVILYLLTTGPLTIWKFFRCKPGHCIKCGYDLRGTEHDVCPECGKELTAKTKS